MFQILGQWIARRPGWLILAWAVIVAAGVTWATRERPRHAADIGSFLPKGHPVNEAAELTRRAFPKLDSRSQIVTVAYRPSGLASDDFNWIGGLADAVEKQMGRQTLSPSVSFLRHRLVSRDGQAAMLIVGLPSNFISAAAAESVNQFESLMKGLPRPAGLTVEITGTAGIGRDYGVATQRALHRTTWVTVIAVLVILVVVYRSPVGALVPLVSIGASVYVALVMLAVLSQLGWNISTMEHIFAVVLIFGMGVDFALFWIARYREELQKAGDFNASAVAATRLAGPAILVSAATTICGLTTLLATDLTPTQSAGKILSIVLTVALLAALTLSPAMARLLGRALFWPIGYQGKSTLGEQRIWPRIAAFVTQRPKTILFTGVLVLGVPALLSARIEPRFDSLSELPPGSSSLRGFNLANEHFAKGELYSNNLLLRFDEPRSVVELFRISQQVARSVAAIPGVHDVYSLDAPVGRTQAGATANIGAAVAWLSQTMSNRDQQGVAGKLLSHMPMSRQIQDTGEFIRTFYLSDKPVLLRFEILIDSLPFSPEAMVLMQRIENVASQAVGEQIATGAEPKMLATGPTPYILGIREVTSRDQIRIKILASLVIAIIVFALIRDLPLTLFMLGATWLTYGAAIAGSEAFFMWVMGENGLDWKVRLIVFVIIVAVGQDYNIFLVSRLFQEPADVSDAEAARRAIVRTGSVISNCGLIMAATLGSLWVGQLGLLRQVGFALALGILLDTFFVRPLLLPSFFLAAHRRRKSRASSQ